MDFDEFEEQEEKKQAQKTSYYGPSAPGSASGRPAGTTPLPAGYEEWEDYMQFGLIPRDHHGF